MRRILLLLGALSCSACSPTAEPVAQQSLPQMPSPRLPPAATPSSPSASLIITASNSFAVIVKPTTGDAGAARQVGDTIVKAEGIKDLFENVTPGAITTVRHTPSGLVCTNPSVVLTPKARVTAFDPAMQTGCISWELGVQNNLMVIPNSGAISAADALAALIRREQVLHSTLKAKNTDDAPGRKGPRSGYVSGSLGSATGPAPQYMHLAVAAVNGWIVLDEASGAEDQAADCDRIADADLNAAIANIHKPGG